MCGVRCWRVNQSPSGGLLVCGECLDRQDILSEQEFWETLVSSSVRTSSLFCQDRSSRGPSVSRRIWTSSLPHPDESSRECLFSGMTGQAWY